MKNWWRIAALVGGGVVAIRWMNRWGATSAETERALPGDELIPEPAAQTTMAISVTAPAERIWPWLVQIGLDRGGMYSYDRLEQLIGLDIHSATEIRPQWQHLAPGDPIRLVPEGWGPLPEGYAFTVAQLDPPHSLVLRQGPVPWDGIWSFHLIPDGPGRCRLVSRTRTARDLSLTGRLKEAATALGTPITWFMTRRMLLTLGQRAETIPVPHE